MIWPCGAGQWLAVLLLGFEPVDAALYTCGQVKGILSTKLRGTFDSHVIKYLSYNS
jgi:hypothetical protein